MLQQEAAVRPAGSATSEQASRGLGTVHRVPQDRSSTPLHPSVCSTHGTRGVAAETLSLCPPHGADFREAAGVTTEGHGSAGASASTRNLLGVTDGRAAAWAHCEPESAFSATQASGHLVHPADALQCWQSF